MAASSYVRRDEPRTVDRDSAKDLGPARPREPTPRSREASYLDLPRAPAEASFSRAPVRDPEFSYSRAEASMREQSLSFASFSEAQTGTPATLSPKSKARKKIIEKLLASDSSQVYTT